MVRPTIGPGSLPRAARLSDSSHNSRFRLYSRSRSGLWLQRLPGSARTVVTDPAYIGTPGTKAGEVVVVLQIHIGVAAAAAADILQRLLS